MLRKSLFLFFAILFLVACGGRPEQVGPSSNTEFEVGKLFEYDGCEVYRFYDYGRAHYFVKCEGAAQTIESHTEGCGKNCTRTVQDVTATVYKVRP